MAPPIIVQFTIPAGQSLSAGVDCTGGTALNRIQMPAEWNAANISFQISVDNNVYVDVFDDSGHELLFPVVPGTARILTAPLHVRDLIGWLKIRSGPRDNPIVQQANRIFTVALTP
jgi:hypothetical protein